MNSARSTRWLAATLVVAAICCAAAFARLNAVARSADDAGRAFAQSQAQLRQLTARPLAGKGASGDDRGGHGDAGNAIDANSQVNRHLRDAAAAAGVADKLVSIEPGEPNQVAGTDYQEMLVFLRLESLSVRELVTFLHAHASADTATHAKAIELSTIARDEGGELWLADVTLAYTSHAPQQLEATPR
jgi:hypothetical protein